MADPVAVSAGLALYQPPALPAGSGAVWGDAAPNHCGQFVWPGRRVLHLPGRCWVHDPNTCPIVNTNAWVLEGTVLVCTGCGLDST